MLAILLLLAGIAGTAPMLHAQPATPYARWHLPLLPGDGTSGVYLMREGSAVAITTRYGASGFVRLWLIDTTTQRPLLTWDGVRSLHRLHDDTLAVLRNDSLFLVDGGGGVTPLALVPEGMTIAPNATDATCVVATTPTGFTVIDRKNDRRSTYIDPLLGGGRLVAVWPPDGDSILYTADVSAGGYERYHAYRVSLTTGIRGTPAFDSRGWYLTASPLARWLVLHGEVQRSVHTMEAVEFGSTVIPAALDGERIVLQHWSAMADSTIDALTLVNSLGVIDSVSLDRPRPPLRWTSYARTLVALDGTDLLTWDLDQRTLAARTIGGDLVAPHTITTANGSPFVLLRTRDNRRHILDIRNATTSPRLDALPHERFYGAASVRDDGDHIVLHESGSRTVRDGAGALTSITWLAHPSPTHTSILAGTSPEGHAFYRNGRTGALHTFGIDPAVAPRALPLLDGAWPATMWSRDGRHLIRNNGGKVLVLDPTASTVLRSAAWEPAGNAVVDQVVGLDEAADTIIAVVRVPGKDSTWLAIVAPDRVDTIVVGGSTRFLGIIEASDPRRLLLRGSAPSTTITIVDAIGRTTVDTAAFAARPSHVVRSRDHDRLAAGYFASGNAELRDGTTFATIITATVRGLVDVRPWADTALRCIAIRGDSVLVQEITATDVRTLYQRPSRPNQGAILSVDAGTTLLYDGSVVVRVRLDDGSVDSLDRPFPGPLRGTSAPTLTVDAATAVLTARAVVDWPSTTILADELTVVIPLDGTTGRVLPSGTIAPHNHVFANDAVSVLANHSTRLLVQVYDAADGRFIALAPNSTVRPSTNLDTLFLFVDTDKVMRWTYRATGWCGFRMAERLDVVPRSQVGLDRYSHYSPDGDYGVVWTNDVYTVEARSTGDTMAVIPIRNQRTILRHWCQDPRDIVLIDHEEVLAIRLWDSLRTDVHVDAPALAPDALRVVASGGIARLGPAVASRTVYLYTLGGSLVGTHDVSSDGSIPAPVHPGLYGWRTTDGPGTKRYHGLLMVP